MANADRRVNKFITEWWTQRRAAGCQFEHLDQFVKGWDYKGDGPWFQYAAVAALHADFTMSTDQVTTTTNFSKQFRTVASALAFKKMGARLSRYDGSLYTKRPRTFVEFGPKPILDEIPATVFNGLSDRRDAAFNQPNGETK